MSFVGLDIGTTGCKAVAFDAGGRVLAQAYREYPMICRQPGFAELDPTEVIQSTHHVLRETAEQLTNDPPQAVSVSSQGEAFVAVGADGSYLTHAMVSSDSRALQQVNDLRESFGESRLYEITGHTAHPMFSLFKLKWLKQNQPEVWARARWFLCLEDLFAQSMGLPPSMGWPLAGRTMLFDVRRHQWSQEILEELGLTPERLGLPVQSGRVIGTIPEKRAAELGLPRSVLLVSGGHDQSCGALGAGVTGPGMAMYGTGTVECITPCFSEAIFTDGLRTSNLATYDFTLPGCYTTVAFSLTGGNLLRWYRDQFCRWEIDQAAGGGKDIYDRLLADMAEDTGGVRVLPYFTPSGTPRFDTETAGAIVGLRLSTTKAQILRALLEGVCLEMKLNMDALSKAGIRISDLRAIGGGARSLRWTKMKADFLGCPISRVAVTEAGCLGAAVLAASAVLALPAVEIAAQWVCVVDVIDPSALPDGCRESRLQEYERLYRCLQSLSHSQAGVIPRTEQQP